MSSVDKEIVSEVENMIFQIAFEVEETQERDRSHMFYMSRTAFAVSTKRS